MPRGENPNSKKNLIRFDQLSEKELRKKQSKGGKNSAKIRKALRSFKEMSTEDSPEEREKMWQMIKKRAMQGNLRAFEIYCDMIGEKPGSRIEISGQLDNPFSGLTEEELRKLAGGDCE